MDNDRFDRFTKLVTRRLSRRAAVRNGAAGLGAATVATVRFRAASARNSPASPVASPPADPEASLLFFQSFATSTLTPKPGETGAFTLTLSQELGQTLYFSDRPERIVGTMPAQTFRDQLGFSASDPPNAALVATTENPGRDDEAVLILELFNPRDGAATHSTVYDVHLLSDYGRVGLRFDREPQWSVQEAQTYGASTLFIDNADYTCGQLNVWCYTEPADGTCNDIGEIGPMKFCYSSGNGCVPCAGDGSSWAAQCNQTLAACGGECLALYEQPWSPGFPGC